MHVERGRRTTSSGDSVRYELYVPEAGPGPRPAVVLTHGFARSFRYQRGNARYLVATHVIKMTIIVILFAAGKLTIGAFAATNLAIMVVLAFALVRGIGRRYQIVSAGPDMTFNTEDDITYPDRG